MCLPNYNTNNKVKKPIKSPKQKKGEPHDISKSPDGTLYYQTAFYTEDQMKNLHDLWKGPSDQTKAYALFGDNNVDRARKDGTKRKGWGNQAGVIGQYDCAPTNGFGYGITTTWKDKRTFKQIECTEVIECEDFQQLMDEDFEELAELLRAGHDIIVPAPKVEKNDIKHNLGTGIAKLPPEWVRYIQQKLDDLGKQAKKVIPIKGEKRYQK